MTWEETTILSFLEEAPDTWYSRREIGRKAVNRRVYEEDRNWATGGISTLLTRGLIEENGAGTFRVKKKAW